MFHLFTRQQRYCRFILYRFSRTTHSSRSRPPTQGNRATGFIGAGTTSMQDGPEALQLAIVILALEQTVSNFENYTLKPMIASRADSAEKRGAQQHRFR
jgi:hypothetical protein